MYRVMLVDDEENVLKSLHRLIQNDSCEVELFTDPILALRRAEVTSFDLVLSDYRMPEMDGLTFLKQFKRLQPDAMRLIISGAADLDVLRDLINEAEIYHFIPKPWDGYEFVTAIEKALAHRSILVENRYLANRMREQQKQLHRQQDELKRLEEENPGITRVKWAEDGSIMVDETGN